MVKDKTSTVFIRRYVSSALYVCIGNSNGLEYNLGTIASDSECI